MRGKHAFIETPCKGGETGVSVYIEPEPILITKASFSARAIDLISCSRFDAADLFAQNS